MSMAEYAQWQAYFQIEPWGSHVQDLRAGQIAAVVANANRDPAQRPQPFLPLDFAPWNHLGQQKAEPETYADPEAHSAAILRAVGYRPAAPENR